MKMIVFLSSGLQPQQLVLHLPPDQRIERAERLIHQQDVGIVAQGPGEAHPLLHPAAQLAPAELRSQPASPTVSSDFRALSLPHRLRTP